MFLERIHLLLLVQSFWFFGNGEIRRKASKQRNFRKSEKKRVYRKGVIKVDYGSIIFSIDCGCISETDIAEMFWNESESKFGKNYIKVL